MSKEAKSPGDPEVVAAIIRDIETMDTDTLLECALARPAGTVELDCGKPIDPPDIAEIRKRIGRSK